MRRLANILVFTTVLVFCASSSGAQYSGRVFKLGVLGLGSAEDMQNRLALVRKPLRDLGYEEGKNLVVESRFASSDYERLPVLASELARLKIDVFLAAGEAAQLALEVQADTAEIEMPPAPPLPLVVAGSSHTAAVWTNEPAATPTQADDDSLLLEADGADADAGERQQTVECGGDAHPGLLVVRVLDTANLRGAGCASARIAQFQLNRVGQTK